MVEIRIKTVGFGRFGNVKSGHFRPFFGVGTLPLVVRIFRRILSLWTPTRCRRVWWRVDTVAVRHWVPEQSPVCHERVGLLGFEFGCRLSLDRFRLLCDFQMTTAPSSDPPANSASAATAPALLDHVVVGPGASQVPASSTSSVAQPASARRRHRPTDTIDTTSTTVLVPRDHSQRRRHPRAVSSAETAKVTRVTNSRISIGYDERHRAAPTAELHSSLAHDIGHVVRTHCPMQWKSWRVMPDEIKAEVRGQLSMNYNLEDLDEMEERLAPPFSAYDDPQVALQEGCPKELEGREDSWEWLCAHFQAPEFVNKAQVNKGNRKKKTLLHHSGSRPFSYRMDARRREGSKFPEIDVFRDVYVRPGNELAESRLPAFLRDSDRVCGSSTGCWISDLDGDVGSDSREEAGDILSRDGECPAEEPRPRSSVQSNSQVIALTAQVATLENKLSVILQSLAQSAFQSRILMRRPPSLHPEHPPDHCPGERQTSDRILGDDSVDFDSLFD
ncbi:hypothetical protein Prudu_871S000100 [Prunus dulcis]|uniref:Ankyrin repeat family protein n=1 Tax=Prunus dulcis TaxID=3755 RepID=A0A5H2XQZ1_PRUDU|nr:hypothetical protein Prudu_871S000100 [Prunus dulcis]